jgi:signal transduction histidine kinase
MTPRSLRLRLVAGGAATIAIALAIAGIALTLLFERHVARSVADDLDVHLRQLLSGIDIGPEGTLLVQNPPADPRFLDPLSGLYWQVNDDRGQMVRSRSLWDTVLDLPADNPQPGDVHRHEIPGPAGARVLVTERLIQMKSANGLVPLRVAVAVNLARVTDARNEFATDLAIALSLLGAVLALATAIQVALGLRPLDLLRQGIADIRAGRNRHLTAQVPVEVQPLVEEVNALLDAREADIIRSRNRAADLAHGLKTPLAALSADSERLRQKGEQRLADDIDSAVDAMRRHVDRELARARLRGGNGLGTRVTTSLAPLARALVATLSRTDAGARVDYEVSIDESTTAALDRTDLAEVMGNLLENATRHARTRVRVAAPAASAGTVICVEDDGIGIAPELRSQALARGVRLDERGGSAGLGLAIVQDVLDAYGWTLTLESSELGGLRALCRADTPRADTASG